MSKTPSALFVKTVPAGNKNSLSLGNAEKAYTDSALVYTTESEEIEQNRRRVPHHIGECNDEPV